MHRLAPAERRVTPVVFLEQKSQLRELEPGQAVVVEAEIERALGRQRRPALVEQLAQEGGLARAAHPDHRVHLPRHGRQARAATRQHRRGAGARAALSFSARTGCRLMGTGLRRGILLSRSHSSRPRLSTRPLEIASAARHDIRECAETVELSQKGAGFLAFPRPEPHVTAVDERRGPATRTLHCRRTSPWLKAESQLLPCSANAVIKGEQFDARNP